MSDELKQLQDKLSEIDSLAKKQKNKLMFDYAIKNAKYKIGEVVTNRATTIAMEKIQWTSGSDGNNPQPVYYGKILTKKLKPRKDGETHIIFENDAILVNKGDKQ